MRTSGAVDSPDTLTTRAPAWTDAPSPVVRTSGPGLFLFLACPKCPVRVVASKAVDRRTHAPRQRPTGPARREPANASILGGSDLTSAVWVGPTSSRCIPGWSGRRRLGGPLARTSRSSWPGVRRGVRRPGRCGRRGGTSSATPNRPSASTGPGQRDGSGPADTAISRGTHHTSTAPAEARGPPLRTGTPRLAGWRGETGRRPSGQTSRPQFFPGLLRDGTANRSVHPMRLARKTTPTGQR